MFVICLNFKAFGNWASALYRFRLNLSLYTLGGWARAISLSVVISVLLYSLTIYIFQCGYVLWLYIFQCGYVLWLYIYIFQCGYVLWLYIFQCGYVLWLYIFQCGYVLWLYIFQCGYVLWLYIFQCGYVLWLYIFQCGYVILLYTQRRFFSPFTEESWLEGSPTAALQPAATVASAGSWGLAHCPLVIRLCDGCAGRTAHWQWGCVTAVPSVLPTGNNVMWLVKMIFHNLLNGSTVYTLRVNYLYHSHVNEINRILFHGFWKLLVSYGNNEFCLFFYMCSCFLLLTHSV